MYLHSIIIKGFRKLENVTVLLSDTTFLIGPNNSGKSSILKAIELFLSSKEKIEDENFYKKDDFSTPCDLIELEGEFRGIDPSVIDNKDWRGFNSQRVLKYTTDKGNDDYRIFYKKIYNRGGKSEYSMKQLIATPKPEYLNISTYQGLKDAGLDIDILNIPENDLTKSIKKSQKIIDEIQEIKDFWDLSTTEEWISNPGGFSSNVISKLPKFLLIPPYDKCEEYGEKKGALYDILDELFKDVRNNSQHYKDALSCLTKLQEEFNPQDDTTELGKMIGNLNSVIQDIFPSANLSASAELTSADSLLPKYVIELGSNISTKPEYQGTGQLRSAVFALLRYKEEREQNKNNPERNIIIGFEEPELYLHPHAAYQMKEVIYELSGKNQIICSTHSPYMIDLSKDRSQVLNKLHIKKDDSGIDTIKIIAFNLSSKFSELVASDKDYLKMILKMDDEFSKIFFSKKILIVEGDTEEIVIKQFINLIDDKKIKTNLLSDWSILKARGKPVIISIIKYLTAMSFKEVKVMHDLDSGTEGAEKFNKHIEDALNNKSNLFPIKECIEDLLGYEAPKSEKPFNAYKKTMEWKTYNDIPQACINMFEKIFDLN